MNDVPPGQGDSDDADELYRRASAQQGGGPSEAVRSAILKHAAQLAAERAANDNVAQRRIKRPTARQAWWRPAAFGTLAAAALAGLLVVPQFIRPTAPSMSASSTAPQTLTRSGGAADDKAGNAALESAPKSLSAARQGQIAAPSAPAAAPRVAQNAPDANSGPVEEIIVTEQRAPAKKGARTEQYAADTQDANAAGKPAAQDELQERAADRAQDARRAVGGAVASSTPPAAVPSAAAPLSNVTVTAGRAAASPRAEAWGDPAVQLRHAAEIGDVVTLQALLDRQPDVDARDANGRTALMLATLRGRAPAVDLLLAAGADANAVDARGTTPLQAALAGDQAATPRRCGAPGLTSAAALIAPVPSRSDPCPALPRRSGREFWSSCPAAAPGESDRKGSPWDRADGCVRILQCW